VCSSDLTSPCTSHVNLLYMYCSCYK